MSTPEIDTRIETHLPLVRQVAAAFGLRALRDDDAMQCALIGLWEAAEQWDRRRPFPPFARQCIRRNLTDYFRSLKRLPPTEPLEETLPAPDQGEEALLDGDLTRRIRARWPEGARERTVLLALLSGHTKSNIARSLGLSSQSVTRIAAAAYRTLSGPAP